MLRRGGRALAVLLPLLAGVAMLLWVAREDEPLEADELPERATAVRVVTVESVDFVPEVTTFGLVKAGRDLARGCRGLGCRGLPRARAARGPAHR